MKRAKIVCTLGPASQTEEILTRMIEVGLDVVRLNFSHGTHKEHAETVGKNHPVLRLTSAATAT